MSQLVTQILHQDYVLTCPDGQEAQLQEAVERVEQQFEQMRDKSKLRSRERVGVLLAVNLAYENLELRQQLQTLQQQLAHAQSVQPHTREDIPPMDTERLAQLEHIAAQYATDLAIAQQLIDRLDGVLAPPANDTEAPQDSASTMPPDEASQLALTATNDSDASAAYASPDAHAAAAEVNAHRHGDFIASDPETL